MATLPATSADWARAKKQQLHAGYATQWDRKTAKVLRRRERGGFLVTQQQITFCELVEQCVRVK